MIGRRVVLTLAVVAATVAGATPAVAGQTAEPSPWEAGPVVSFDYVVEFHDDVLFDLGFSQRVGEPGSGTLKTGETAADELSFEGALGEGTYHFIGLCDADCGELTLRLLDHADGTVATVSGNTPVIAFAAEYSDTVEWTVSMGNCATATGCRWALSAYLDVLGLPQFNLPAFDAADMANLTGWIPRNGALADPADLDPSLLQLLAERGKAWAQMNLGIRYANAGEYGTALRWVREAARRGFAPAQELLDAYDANRSEMLQLRPMGLFDFDSVEDILRNSNLLDFDNLEELEHTRVFISSICRPRWLGDSRPYLDWRLCRDLKLWVDSEIESLRSGTSR